MQGGTANRNMDMVEILRKSPNVSLYYLSRLKPNYLVAQPNSAACNNGKISFKGFNSVAR